MKETERIRDPVHGLIVFDLQDEVDRAAWSLINTPEFQRLRRIRQLGLSELTFPGASHTRFAHSIGVFHVARKLMKLVEKRLPRGVNFNEDRRKIALLSALLHDLGHGPFSHAFEAAEKVRFARRPGAYKRHENWTGEIITNSSGNIFSIVENVRRGIAKEISQLLTSDPTDIYAAVVSSSFDADRLDYLRRDKLMTGSGAGGIDFDWLLDNVCIADVPIDADDSASAPGSSIQTFCLNEKALQAAEAFLLARYHLYCQVFYHKTTRGSEQLMIAFLRAVSSQAKSKQKLKALGLNPCHPLVSYYRSKHPTVEDYRRLDDWIVWSAVEQVARINNEREGDLAKRLLDRRLPKVISIDRENPTKSDRARHDYIKEHYGTEIGDTIFEDRVQLSAYSEIGGEAPKSHKMLRILKEEEAHPMEITSLAPAIKALTKPHELLRYYFLDESACESITKIEG